MDFFNKIGKKASETYKVTAEKTGKLAKEAKLRMKMNENKSDIEDLYKKIGKKVYEQHLTEDNINIKELLEEEVTKIDVLSDEIENILKEILSLKDMKKCKDCYEKIEKTAKYCPNCGAEQENNVEEDTADATVENDEADETVDETTEEVIAEETAQEEAKEEAIDPEEEPAKEVEIVEDED